jgi:hypothetical protein
VLRACARTVGAQGGELGIATVEAVPWLPEALAAGASNRARFVVSRLTSQAQLFDYIEVLHKQERMHSGIGYAALAEFERAAG